MQAKKLAIVALLVAGIVGVSYGWFATHAARGAPGGAQPWKLRADLTATYVSTELRQVDPANAALFLYYEIENKTDSDYRLGATPGLVIMSRLRSGGSLSSQEDVRFSFPFFSRRGSGRAWRSRCGTPSRGPAIKIPRSRISCGTL